MHDANMNATSTIAANHYKHGDATCDDGQLMQHPQCHDKQCSKSINHCISCLNFLFNTYSYTSTLNKQITLTTFKSSVISIVLSSIYRPPITNA